jgi:uncharacterized protein (TIGR03067 family)
MRTVLVVLVGLLIAAKNPKGDAAKKDLKTMQGTWKVVVHEAEGKRTTDKENQKADVKLIVKGNKYTLYFAKKKGGEGTIKLDPTQKPRAIDATTGEGGKGPVMRGIYEFKDGDMKVCFGPRGGKRPTEFAAKKGSQGIYIRYRRVKKDKE